MTTKYTLQDALAFVAITGHKKFLHIHTRIALTPDLVSFQVEDLNQPMYQLTAEGWKLAQQSRFWKAHSQLASMGFLVDVARRNKPGHVSYKYTEETKRCAFTGKHGRVYASMEQNEAGNWSWKMALIGEHRNGVERG